jgi:hypothetical protein
MQSRTSRSLQIKQGALQHSPLCSVSLLHLRRLLLLLLFFFLVSWGGLTLTPPGT